MNYVPFREQQFEIIGDCVAERYNGKPVRILDLCCGPGSLTFRLLRRFPDASAICIDLDPWLIAMGRAISGFEDRISWLEADLTQSGWCSDLQLGAIQAIVSSTATHWFEPDEVASIYNRLPALLQHQGLFLNADTIPQGTDRVRRFAQQLTLRWQNGTLARGGDDWQTFWKQASEEAEFKQLLEERDRKLGKRRPRVFLTVDEHSERLLAAGFSECGELWRFGDAGVLLAIR